MSKILKFPREHAERNRTWQSGYQDGYRGLPCRTGMPDVYYTGFEVGKSDHEEDQEAYESGDLDMLTDEEAREIFGDPDDLP